MKIVRTEVLINAGGFADSAEWRSRHNEICESIKTIEWPPGSGSFTLYDQPGKKRGQGSGVKPIKEACMSHLQRYGWKLETRIDVATVKIPGPVDAARAVLLPVSSGDLRPSESSVPTVHASVFQKRAVFLESAHLECRSA